VYGRNDERHLQFIVKAKRLGYTPQEIEILLKDARKDCSRCPSARHILGDRVTHNRQQLDTLGPAKPHRAGACCVGHACPRSYLPGSVTAPVEGERQGRWAPQEALSHA
jgi:DNA-binding transcriptional MerR regulator